MASSPLMLQRPPAPPPDISGQTGAGAPQEMAPIAQMIRDRIAQGGAQGPGAPAPGGPPPGGAANPAGQFLALEQTIERLLKQFGGMSDVFQPYADRALAIVQAGVAEVVKNTPGAAQTPNPMSPVTGASGAPASASPTVGPGAPPFPG